MGSVSGEMRERREKTDLFEDVTDKVHADRFGEMTTQQDVQINLSELQYLLTNVSTLCAGGESDEDRPFANSSPSYPKR